jgi:large conductance mechanosensitive channel
MSLTKEFKEFISRGNVFDLAVAVVIGAAFSDVVKTVVDGLIMPLVAKVRPKHSNWETWKPDGFAIGHILSSSLNFLIVSFVVFVVVVKGMQRLHLRAESAKAPTKTCPECLEDVPAAARRCRACTSQL